MVCSEGKENNIKSISKLGLASTRPWSMHFNVFKGFYGFRGPLYLTSFLEHVSDMIYDFGQVRDESS